MNQFWLAIKINVLSAKDGYLFVWLIALCFLFVLLLSCCIARRTRRRYNLKKETDKRVNSPLKKYIGETLTAEPDPEDIRPINLTGRIIGRGVPVNAVHFIY